jgi:hypothetical protein
MHDRDFTEAVWSLDPIDLDNIDQYVQGKVSFDRRISILSATGWPAECRRGTSRKATMLVV